MSILIRYGKLDELEQLRDIERRAGIVFAEHDMPDIAADEPPSVDVLKQYCTREHLWVAADNHNQPVAYLVASVVDDCAHIDQVSVDTGQAGKRIGSALIDTLEIWAQAHNLVAITLTTFADIPWNAPYYRKLGFQDIDESQMTNGLKQIRDEEKQMGLDRWPRICMRRNILSEEHHG